MSVEQAGDSNVVSNSVFQQRRMAQEQERINKEWIDTYKKTILLLDTSVRTLQDRCRREQKHWGETRGTRADGDEIKRLRSIRETLLATIRSLHDGQEISIATLEGTWHKASDAISNLFPNATTGKT